MVQKKGKYRVCLYCSHEVKLYNNDEQFSWDLHKQEQFHIRRRLKGKKKINFKDFTNMYVKSMRDLFQSDSTINSWAEELIRLADEQVAKQERNVEVEKAVAHSFSAVYNGKFKIMLFGSRISGLTISEAGDLDIFLDTSENEDMSLVDNPELENHYLQKLENYMKTNEYNTWVNVVSILSCRTPIVKGLHYDTKMQCDITVMNGFGIVNTHLMILYLKNIPKLRRLILIIREWSLAAGFTKERDINNYALSMLVLFYLQQEKYAPSVDDLKFDYAGPTNIISGYECINYEQVNCNWNSYKDTTKASLKELLLGFFTYFKSFDFKNDVVCPLVGKPVKKKLFAQNGRKLPSAMHPYVEKLKHKGETFKMNKNSMCIQDPIDLAHNLTKSASDRFTYNFMDLCDSSKRALETMN